MAIQIMDFSVLEGHRGKDLQNLYYDQGKSKLRFPDGKHNSNPSLAVDLAPYPIDWNDSKRFILLAGVVLGCAHALGVKMRWGGWWQGDISKYKKGAQSFNDLPHYEVL